MMKSVLVAIAALALTTPAHALSIVSLHSGLATSVSYSLVNLTVIAASVASLCGVIAFRLLRR